MISIKNNHEIELMRTAGKIVALTHEKLASHIKPGVTTLELDNIANQFITNKDAKPSFKGFNGFPAAICTSINEEVVHGIPSNRSLLEGDIISIDIGVCYKGYHADSAWTYKVGDVGEVKDYLLKHSCIALYKGLEEAKPGNRVGDISHAIEEYSKEHNFGIVKELVGHGIGNNLHEAPEVPNYGTKNTGPKLKPGMCIAIEPMLNYGDSDVNILDDEWTVVTRDGSPSAHFEHTVLITHDGYEILTKR